MYLKFIFINTAAHRITCFSVCLMGDSCTSPTLSLRASCKDRLRQFQWMERERRRDQRAHAVSSLTVKVYKKQSLQPVKLQIC